MHTRGFRLSAISSRQVLITILLTLCAITWLVAAYHPYNIEAWMLEQIASVIGAGVLIWAAKHVRFSNLSLIGLTLLFIVHTTGTHFTYSLTPYDAFCQRVLGISPNDIFCWQRNHYDRFTHLLFGIACVIPLQELFAAYLTINKNRAWFLSVMLIVAISALYELLEWLAALIFAPDTGTLYLGTQGDVWDAQIDIALALVGAIGVILIYECASEIRKRTAHNIL